MVWWKRKKPKVDPRVSQEHWATWMTFEQQQKLEQLVLQHWQVRAPDLTVEDGVIKIDGMRYGLENLSQNCRPVPEEEWPLAVQQHFERLAAGEEEGAEWDASCETFAWAQSMLRVRLYPPKMEGLAMIVCRQDLDGVATALVADRPSSIVSIHQDLVDKWGKPVDELFDLALRQTLEHEEIQFEWAELDGDVDGVEPFRVAILSSDGLLAAGHALALGDRPDLIGEHGTLFAVPNRHHVLAYPIGDTPLPRVVNNLLPIVVGMFADGPGSITPNFYWRRPDGVVEAQPVELREADDGNTTASFAPTEGFQALAGRG